MKENSLIRLFKIILRKNYKILGIAFFILVISSMLNLGMPQIIRIILDDAIVNKDSELLIKLIILYSLILIASAAIRLFLEYIYSKLRIKLSIYLKTKVLKHLSKLSGQYYSNIKTGEILNIIENDIAILGNIGVETLFSLIMDLIIAVISFTLLIKMQSELLIMVIILQLIILLVQSKFTNLIAKKTSEIRTYNGKLANIIQEYIFNIMNVVISKSTLYFFRRYFKSQRELAKNKIKLDVIFYSNIAISSVLANLIIIFIYGFGGLKIIKGEMSIGELIVFQQYTNMLITPCIRIIKSNTKIQQSLVSIDRVFSILDENIDIIQNNNGKLFDPNLESDIQLCNVNFAYGNKKILNNINMSFKNGCITAIIGSSGCGKSTLVNLLFRLWDIDKGEILIDGESIKKYNLKSFRKNISIISQDLLLLDDSIFNNLTLGRNKISLQKVEDVCNNVGLLEYINGLEDGFNTNIGENGTKLSVGQKQRIAIARAILNDTKVIIFDEATSSLDNISQKVILQNIKPFLKNKVVIIVAHRLSTIKDADNIYIMNNGEVIEEGSHDELLLNKGAYFSMLNTKYIEEIAN